MPLGIVDRCPSPRLLRWQIPAFLYNCIKPERKLLINHYLLKKNQKLVMKKLSQLLGVAMVLFFTMNAQAQSATNADYFDGKWNVLVKGLPQGDTRMVVTLEKKDSTMTGAVLDTTGKEVAKIDKVELEGTTATVYFHAQGYDVNLVMTKKDDDHITGSMMGMFEAEGDRVKALK
jgi:hypothetical protein